MRLARNWFPNPRLAASGVQPEIRNVVYEPLADGVPGFRLANTRTDSGMVTWTIHGLPVGERMVCSAIIDSRYAQDEQIIVMYDRDFSRSQSLRHELDGTLKLSYEFTANTETMRIRFMNSRSVDSVFRRIVVTQAWAWPAMDAAAGDALVPWGGLSPLA